MIKFRYMLDNMKMLVLIIVMALCHYGGGDVPSKLLLSVYYESKCPDSRQFVAKQLVPAVNLLQDHLVIHLVPFGKAHSTPGNRGFVCQHGPAECLGNKVQDCALHHMRDRPDSEKVDYVACEMASLAATTGDLRCVRKANLPVNQIVNCMNSSEGTELQLDSEYITKLLSPKFIPSVTMNGEFNQQIQDQAQVDLVGTLCSLMKDVPNCAAYYNHNALRFIFV